MPADGQPADLAVLTLARIAVRRWKTLASVALVTSAATVGFALLQEDYLAESKFLPQLTEPQLSRLSGIAAQFGFDLGGSFADQSLDFYGELLKSRGILERVAQESFRFPKGLTPEAASDTIEGTLLDLYDISGDTPEERLLKATDVLEEDIAVRTDIKAGVITLRTRAPWPGLAMAVNRRLLDLVNEFNLQTRQSHAGKERAFVEARMQDAHRELDSAEDDFARFLEHNRRYQDSPQLAFEAARLQRRVELRQQVFTSLAQAYERARIDEVRNTPVITVIDGPEGSARSNAHALSAAALGLLVGGTAALAFVLTAHSLARYRREHPQQYAELRDAVALIPVVGRWARAAAQREERNAPS